jgi:hypothetical protein
MNRNLVSRFGNSMHFVAVKTGVAKASALCFRKSKGGGFTYPEQNEDALAA